MKPFKEDEKTIVYDPIVEIIRDKALESLDEALGNPMVAAKIFDNKKSKLYKEIRDLKEKVRYGKEFNELNKILTSPNYALSKLTEFVGPELQMKLRKKETQDEIMEAVRKKMIIPQWLQAIIGTPAGICVACMVGYTVDADAGITSGLKTKNEDLHDMVDEVWKNAMNELHPFQRGPTHQGTKHCTQVLENLDVLLKEIETHKGFTFNIEVKVVLSLAAALHDIGKGDVIDPRSKKHAQNGAKVIKSKPDIFNIDLGFKSFVSEIVNTHAPEGRLHTPSLIKSVKAEPIRGKGVDTTCNKDIVEQACSIFQLADTMDTTKDRVSVPVFKMLSELYSSSSDPDYIKVSNLIKIREKMDSVYPEWTPFPCIKVKINPPIPSEAKKQIKDENEDLHNTGAESVLSSNNWFSKLDID